MNEGARQAYLDKSAAQLKEWGAKVEVVKAKAAQGAADVRIDFHNHVERWQEKEAAFKGKMEELKTAGVEHFESMKAGMQGVWAELSGLVDKIEEKK